MNIALLPVLIAAPLLQRAAPCELAGVRITNNLTNGVVALSGNTVALGSSPGQALIYVASGGVWSQEATLSIPNTAYALALDGDTLLVGMPHNDDLGANAGSVQVFLRQAGAWNLEATLYADSPVAFDIFGFDVSLDGDVALVGAPGREIGGVAIIFERVGGIWSEAATIDVTTAPTDQLGDAVALSGDTALLVERTGDGYVFVESGGLWVQQAHLPLPPTVFNWHDVDADLHGDAAIIGHREFGARIFARDGSSWVEQAAISTADENIGGPSRLSVAIEQDIAVMGRLVAEDSSGASVFVRGGKTWTRLADLLPATDFPTGVAIEGNTVVAAQWGTGFAPGNAFQYELPSFIAPSVGYRNAGTNPDSYVSTPAYIGQTLHFTVDLATTGHEQALVIGFDSPFGLTLGGGQTLLCLDLLGSGGELINTGFHPGPTAEIDLAVPNNIALIGFGLCTQAVHAFGLVPFALSNAQDIVIGACL